jgi:opacity protein-like surface antigen
MKRLALLLLIAVTTVSIGLSAGLVGFGAQFDYANLNVPDPLKSAYGPGYGGGAHIDFHLGIATIRVNGDYITFGADEGVLRDLIYNEVVATNAGLGIDKSAISVGGGRINILSFGANGKFGIPNRGFCPYAIAGLGVASLSSSDFNVSYQGMSVASQSGFETQTKFMVNAGAGVDFFLGRLALFVEAKYTWIFTDNEKSTYIPLTLGVTF